MASGLGPVVPRRRLGAELRRLRERANQTIEQVAAALEFSVSKLSRLETGKGIPRTRDVRDLLDHFGVADVAQRDRMARWARDGQRQGWWTGYSDVLVANTADSLVPDGWDRYVALEAEASAIASFEPSVLHGLVQTRDYARAVLGELATQGQAMDPQQCDRLVEVRVRRQQRLFADDPLRLDLVLDEAALRRPVGGRTTMRAQLASLVELAGRTNIRVRVLPFAVGVHRAIAGSFEVLRFTELDDQDVVYVEGHIGSIFFERVEDVRTYERLFASLEDRTLDEARSREFIEDVARSW